MFPVVCSVSMSDSLNVAEVRNLYLKNLHASLLQAKCDNYLWIIVIFFIRCLDSHSDGTHLLQVYKV